MRARLIGSVIGVTVLVSVLGNIFTTSSINGWYTTLSLPWFTPPGQVIGIVWTTLYILTALSAILSLSNSEGKPRQLLIALYLLNVVLNVVWSALFFGLHTIGIAAIEAILLASSVLLLIVQSWSIHKGASLLLVPYFAWVSFAAFLTYSVWQLN